MQTALYDFLLFGLFPVALFFCLERFAVFKMKRSRYKAKLAKIVWLHPNSISRMRYPMGLLSVVLYAFVSEELAIFWFSAWMISDITDGSIARHLELVTEKGRTVDPLSDKLLYFPPLFYAVYLGFLDVALVGVLFAVDVIGQASRIFARETAANLFGKTKTFIAVMTLGVPFLYDAYFADLAPTDPDWETWARNVSNLLLAIACVLSVFSFFFRIIPNYWYANILSILNLLCGLAGMGIAVIGGQEYLKYSFGLVFLGQFLDLFDGRAAERWGSPPWGELLDDLADGTNFGGTVAFIVFFSFQSFLIGLSLALTHLACTVYRLMRFLNDKKFAGVKTGVDVFNGLPSPGGAFFTGASVILLNYQSDLDPEIAFYLKIATVLTGSLLMISRIPYIHVGRVLLPQIPKFSRVVLYAGVLMLVVMTFQTRSVVYLFTFLFAGAALYVIFGIRFKFR